jgi:hypothetical protein
LRGSRVLFSSRRAVVSVREAVTGSGLLLVVVVGAGDGDSEGDEEVVAPSPRLPRLPLERMGFLRRLLVNQFSSLGGMMPDVKTARVKAPKDSGRMSPAGASRTSEETRWGKEVAKCTAIPPPSE